MLKESDPALYRELLEKDAMKRAQERITLKHKNTSKVIVSGFPECAVGQASAAIRHAGRGHARTSSALLQS